MSDLIYRYIIKYFRVDSYQCGHKALYFFFKRFTDIVVSFTGLVLLIPVFLLISLIIKVTSRGPVFFKQLRAGKNSRYFYIYKFRTMIKSPFIKDAVTSRDDKRITRPGRILRKYKLDELPQLINVLRGEMSLVGPRPEVPKFVNQNPEFKLLLQVKPGITSPASVNFYNEEEILQNVKKNRINIEDYYKSILLPEKNKYRIELYRKYEYVSDLLTIANTIFLLKNKKKISN